MLETEFFKFFLNVGFVISLIKIIYNKFNSDFQKTNKKVEILQNTINMLEIYLLKNYVKQEDFKESIKYLSVKLDRIFDKLEQKQDKIIK